MYTKALTVNSEGVASVAPLLKNLFSDDFQSINSAQTLHRDALIGNIQYFWMVVPNLKWEIQEMFQVGDRVIVRSVASGNPNGDFMGVPCNGSKAFSIMTIDIHTVENDKIVQIYHQEEWMTAINQLK